MAGILDVLSGSYVEYVYPTIDGAIPYWSAPHTLNNSGWLWEPMGGNMIVNAYGSIKTADSGGPTITFASGDGWLSIHNWRGTYNDGVKRLELSTTGYLDVDCDSGTRFFVSLPNAARDAFWVADSNSVEYARFVALTHDGLGVGLHFTSDASIYMHNQGGIHDIPLPTASADAINYGFTTSIIAARILLGV